MSENKKITVQIKESSLKTVYYATGGQSFSLESFKGKNLVLYFILKIILQVVPKRGWIFLLFIRNF